jgi:MerR family transcriptional regulator, light-induced transcriptional regulator
VADEALTAGAVARRLGVAVTTLRTWHQRYGLGPSQHTPGQHRRYTPDDMDRLQVMRRLTAQGVAPAEAASWARRMPVQIDSLPEDVPGAPPAPGASRAGGGNAIPVGRAGPAARGLARAAMRLDAAGLREQVEMIIQGRGVIRAWDEVIMPVLIGVGERYEATKRFIEVEHLLSRAIIEAFAAVPRPPSGTVPRVLLSAAEEEQHTLPMEALAAALAESGVPVRQLGARVPARALADAVARTGPEVVILWSQLPATGDPAQLRDLLAGSRRPMLVAAAGPGWRKDELPDEVPLLATLSDAVRVVRAAL